MAATARTPTATPPQRTCVRRRPRSRGARTRTDFPQREQRSRSERSSKPQWGHVRVGTSVIVGGIGLTSVDIVTGSCQSAASWIASTPAPQPAGRPPAPGRLAYVQAFLNTFWDLDGDGVGERGPRPAPTGRGCAPAASPAPPRRPATSTARSSCARRCGRCACANHDDGDAPAALAVLDRIAHAVAPAAALAPSLRTGALEPAGDGPDAACALALAIVFAARADGTFARLKACPHAHCGWAFYDALAQPLGPVVLDAHLRQPHQGRGVPAPHQRPPTLIERTVTAGARPRFTVTPRSRPSAGPPDTLSHDAMAARLQSPLASAATRALGVRPRHLERHRVVAQRRRRDDAARRRPRPAAHRSRASCACPRRRRSSAGAREHARRRGDRRRLLRRARRHAAGRAAHQRHRPAPRARSTRRGATSAACLHVGRRPRRARAARRAARRAAPATCCRPARCSCATARRASTATSRASPPARASSTPTSPPGRYPRAALGLGARRAAARRRLRRARRRRGRAHAGRAGRGARRPRRRARRSTSTAAARPRWSAPGGCATSRARTTASCSRGGRPVSTVARVHAAVTHFGYNRRVRVLSALMFFPRGGSAHVARALARELPAHGCDVTVVSGSLAGGRGDAERFYAGLRRPRGATSTAATRRCTRPTRTAPTRPTASSPPSTTTPTSATSPPGRARWRRRAPPTPTSCTCTTSRRSTRRPRASRPTSRSSATCTAPSC